MYLIIHREKGVRCPFSFKSLLIMKLIAVILLTACLQVSARGYGQMITLSEQNAPLTKIFKEIEKQSGYFFFYRYKELQPIGNINITVKDASIDQVMNICLKGLPLSYAVEDNTIVIARKKESRGNEAMPVVDVKGKVVDGASGQPLPGVTVVLKGTGSGTVTGQDGSFELHNVPDNGVLVYSFIGYTTIEAGINGGGSPLLIRLQPVKKELSQLVVTALGIKREEASLGYAVQKIDGDAVTNAPTSNWINALSGKVAGLNLDKLGGPTGSSNVVLRGDNVLALGGSTALIVVDGVPISTTQSGTGDGPLVAADNPVDFGSSLSDLDPDDIESISVLKGPGAAALYGSRASNGAIIITTKSGSKTKGLGVFFDSYLTYYEVNRYPDYQFEYGTGTAGATYYSYTNSEDGTSTRQVTTAWGPKFMGQLYYQYNSPYDTAVDPNPITSPRLEKVPWLPHKDAYSAFFNPAFSYSNTVGVTGGGYRASVTYNKYDWIVPNTGFKRISFAFSGNQKISSKITLNTKLNYTRKYTDNLPSQGYNNQSIMYFMAQTEPNNDVRWYKPKWTNGLDGVQELSPFWSGLDNPYVIAYDMLNGSDRHNVIGNINATVQLAKRLTLTVRSGLDFSYEFRTQQRPLGTYKWKEGMYRQQNVYRLEANSDFLLKYDNELPFGLKYVFSFGGNQRYNDYKWDNLMADKLVLPNVYNIANSKDPVQTGSDRQKFVVNSLYGFINLDYKDKAYLEITARNDWSSKLPAQNASFFYPSINTSVLLNKIFQMPQVFSLAKLRASYAATGVDPGSAYGFLMNYSGTSFAGSLTLPNTIPNPNLKPQFTSAVETGIDFRFFNDRLGIDVALYRNITRNQILSLPVDGASGFTSAMTNIGKITNKGIELQLHGTPVITPGSFKWDITVNWSANRNKVLDISSAVGNNGKLELYTVSWANIHLVAVEGEPLGQLYGLGFKRSPDGQIINDNTGIPIYSDTIQNWGNTNPDWQGSILNGFTYRNFTFSFLFDLHYGGKIMSYTHAILAAWGKLKETLPGRDNGIVGKGVVQNPDGSFSPNTKNANAGIYYKKYFDYTNMETNTFSDTYTKLREVSVNYSFPKAWFRRAFIKSASFGVYGRDLFVWSKFPSFDPETATLNSSTIFRGIEIGQFPSTRSIGASLHVQF